MHDASSEAVFKRYLLTGGYLFLIRKGNEMKDLKSALKCAQEDVRKLCPMAPSITNFVTIDFVANAQIAVGGSAAMVLSLIHI